MHRKRRTVAILGVDGSGKSTAIGNLSNVYQDNCTVTYMGNTRFEDKRIEEFKKRRHCRPIVVYLKWRCFWTRYNNAIKKGTLAIFDRYVHEIFINDNKGFYGKLNVILYKFIFPRPSKIVYLYCSGEDSLRRKHDITKPEEFLKMKRRFDAYFIGKKGVLSLNSSLLSPEEITNNISDFIDKSFKK